VYPGSARAANAQVHSTYEALALPCLCIWWALVRAPRCRAPPCVGPTRIAV